jgi:hypothetical protein
MRFIKKLPLRLKETKGHEGLKYFNMFHCETLCQPKAICVFVALIIIPANVKLRIVDFSLSGIVFQ